MSDYNSQKNRAVWFDIPVADLDRASKFYAAVLAAKVPQETFGEMSFCVIEHHEGNGGCLFVNPAEVSPIGVLLYLNADGRIRDAVRQAEQHGGKVLQSIHSLGPHGFRVLLLDCEGNRVALHSNTDA